MSLERWDMRRWNRRRPCLSVAEATVDMTAHAVARGDRGEVAARFTVATIVVLTYALAVGAFFVVLLTDALRNTDMTRSIRMRSNL
jgi:hypothetical protein